MITISCVVPIILALNKHLQSRSSPNSMLSSFASTLHHSLKSRFRKLFETMGIQFPTLASHNQLEFSSNFFLQAAAFDTAFAFNWMEDHPGTSAEQEAITSKRYKIECRLTLITNRKSQRGLRFIGIYRISYPGGSKKLHYFISAIILSKRFIVK